ncbi:adenylate kinase [Mycoplasma flocculare]|uniref:Adenylate kinase n=1 Tax=Mesomycoplasma flocculare TaxID=2128 RepID=A0AAW9XA19_MESFC|nr:nucleoside monophosphate kinase [Mesomycoplasma flocculare]MXR56686.1 adenylate kinase [Mesomycoplasma flocculare]
MISEKRILFIGAPGSGKGSLSKILVDKYKLVHISTGELFRLKIKEDQKLAKKIQSYVSSGGYVPDKITNKIVADFISKLPKNRGYILDGYPRTIEQLNFMNENGIEVDLVFYLKIRTDTIINRLRQRLFCQECQKPYNLLLAKPKIAGKCDLDNNNLITRNDDRPEIISVRIEKFNLSIAPIVQHYENINKIHYLDTENPLEKIIEEIEKWL